MNGYKTKRRANDFTLCLYIFFKLEKYFDHWPVVAVRIVEMVTIGSFLSLGGCDKANPPKIEREPTIERMITDEELDGMPPQAVSLWPTIKSGELLGQPAAKYNSALSIADDKREAPETIGYAFYIPNLDGREIGEGTWFMFIIVHRHTGVIIDCGVSVFCD